MNVSTSNGNASETKANESFDNGVFFYIEAKRTPSIVSKLFSKRRKHINDRIKIIFDTKWTRSIVRNCFQSEANTSNIKHIILEAKRTQYIERKLFSKRREHIRKKGNYFRSKANTFDNKKIIFEAKRTRPTVSKLFSKRSVVKWSDSPSWGVGEYFVQVVGIYLNLAIFATWKSLQHWLTNYIDTKAKCRHLKNWHVKGLCGRCYLSEVPLSPYTLYSVYILYTYSHREGGEGVNSSQSWVKNTNIWLKCNSSI